MHDCTQSGRMKVKKTIYRTIYTVNRLKESPSTTSNDAKYATNASPLTTIHLDFDNL